MERIQQLPITVAEIELVYRNPLKVAERIQIRTSQDAQSILKQCWNPEKIQLVEEFKVLLLNTASHILGLYHHSTGSTEGTIADTRLILATALKANANKIILAHNHPTGNLNPSNSDRQLTQKIKQAAEIMGISVLDHIILTAEGYYSFQDEGGCLKSPRQPFLFGSLMETCCRLCDSQRLQSAFETASFFMRMAYFKWPFSFTDLSGLVNLLPCPQLTASPFRIQNFGLTQ